MLGFDEEFLKHLIPGQNGRFIVNRRKVARLAGGDADGDGVVR